MLDRQSSLPQSRLLLLQPISGPSYNTTSGGGGTSPRASVKDRILDPASNHNLVLWSSFSQAALTANKSRHNSNGRYIGKITFAQLCRPRHQLAISKHPRTGSCMITNFHCCCSRRHNHGGMSRLVSNLYRYLFHRFTSKCSFTSTPSLRSWSRIILEESTDSSPSLKRMSETLVA